MSNRINSQDLIDAANGSLFTALVDAALQINDLRAKLGAAEKALIPKPLPEGLVPHAYQLESTIRNADYWYEWAHKTEDKGEAVLYMAQAMFAWKNAALAKAEDAMKAEQRIRESQEQEPVEVASMGSAILFFKGNKQLASRPKLYLSPIIPPTLEELQRENAELKRKLDSINLPESAYCAAGVEPCACAVANNLDATRYRFLRNQDIETDFPRSGLFIGKIPSNECLTGLDADLAIDAELKRKLAEISPSK